MCIFFLSADTAERENKRKGSGSSSSVVHWSDFQPSSSESTNRLINCQKTLNSSHRHFKQQNDSPYRRGDDRVAGSRMEHRYHPPPEEHPPPVRIKLFTRWRSLILTTPPRLRSFSTHANLIIICRIQVPFTRRGFKNHGPSHSHSSGSTNSNTSCSRKTRHKYPPNDRIPSESEFENASLLEMQNEAAR